MATFGLTRADIFATIERVIDNLIEINDTEARYLLKLPDGRVIDTKGWVTGWEWTHGIGLYGLWQLYSIDPSDKTEHVIKCWYDCQLPKGTTKNINTMAVFLTMACMYENKDTTCPSYVYFLNEWAEWAMNELPRTKYGGFQHITYLEENKDELWVDTLMMTVLPLAKIGIVLNRPHYVEEAKKQFLLHIQYLQDKTTGLFFHGWKFVDGDEASQGHNFVKAKWARGNAWITIAIPEILEMLDLPTNDHFRVYLLDVLRAQCKALKRLQAANGMWRTLLDIPTQEGSYEEASATAGFAYGLLKAVRKGYIGAEYKETGLKGVKAVLDHIGPNGELRAVSFGTGMGHTLKHYKDIPLTSMPYGQAMAIMALGEFLKVN